jgi:hypothetical protein
MTRKYMIQIALALSLIIIVLLILAARRSASGREAPPVARDDALRLEVPASIKHDHEALHVELQNAIKAGGKTGETAGEVERLLAPHFAKEEQFALPPLAVLPAVASGELPLNAHEALALSERFKSEYPAMLKEHEAIVVALKRLVSAAKAERKPAQVEFVERLMHHAEMEEQVLYPTTLLIGEYLRLRLAK